MLNWLKSLFGGKKEVENTPAAPVAPAAPAVDLTGESEEAVEEKTEEVK